MTVQVRRRVVLVDDHEGFRVSAGVWLTHEGYDVVGAAPTGEEGIRLVGETVPDVVLLDLHLPDRSGVEVAEAVARLPHAPVVILISSDTAAADDPVVRGAPVAGFLPKRDLACATIDALLP